MSLWRIFSLQTPQWKGWNPKSSFFFILVLSVPWLNITNLEGARSTAIVEPSYSLVECKFQSYIYPKAGWLDHLVVLLLAFWGISLLIFTVATLIYIPSRPTEKKRFLFPTFLSASWLFILDCCAISLSFDFFLTFSLMKTKHSLGENKECSCAIPNLPS